MKPTQVAILGCGPAGLLAAHAALIGGHEPIIYSMKKKSPLAGTQYLHQPIPKLSSVKPQGEVVYIKIGTQQGYAAKVYGSPDAPCSWAKFQSGSHEIWSLNEMYNDLWEIFRTSITNTKLNPADIPELCSEFPLVINSVPRPRLCKNPDHDFKSQSIWITETKNAVPFVVPGNMIIYDGTPDVHWYRASRIFGKCAVETSRPMSGASWQYGHKPIRTNCDCHIKHREFFNVGRFGQWKKGVLSHNAFWDTVKILEQTIGRTEHALL